MKNNMLLVFGILVILVGVIVMAEYDFINGVAIGVTGFLLAAYSNHIDTKIGQEDVLKRVALEELGREVGDVKLKVYDQEKKRETVSYKIETEPGNGYLYVVVVSRESKTVDYIIVNGDALGVRNTVRR